MGDRRAAVITASNSVAAGTADDSSAPVAADVLEDLGFTIVESVVVPDGVDTVSDALIRLSESVDLIITTGGTGLSPTDLTPEATLSVIDREIPGISEALRADTFGKVPFGMLSRGVSGVRGSCVIINLPGSPKAVAEGMAVIGPVLEHAVDIATGVFGRHD